MWHGSSKAPLNLVFFNSHCNKTSNCRHLKTEEAYPSAKFFNDRDDTVSVETE